jgi:hypothetical protein
VTSGTPAQPVSIQQHGHNGQESQRCKEHVRDACPKRDTDSLRLEVDHFVERLDKNRNNGSAILLGDHSYLGPDLLLQLVGACRTSSEGFIINMMPVLDILAQQTAAVLAMRFR